MTSTATAHDHIVLLLGNEDFERPPRWLSQNFNIIEGGTHASGSSRNKLIVFKDGTYLELFNWITEPREFLDWADKSPGLIDFALTTMPPVDAEDNYKTVQDNLSKITEPGVSFEQPKSGGRKRADGIDVKWQTTRPSYSTTKSTPDQRYFAGKRMDVPFFCHDITERSVRVPFGNESITTHPCGAVGIDHVQVMVPQSHLDTYIDLYGAVLNVQRLLCSVGDREHDHEVFLEIRSSNSIDKRPASVAISSIALESDAEGRAFLEERGIGICSITLRRAGDVTDGNNVISLGSDAIGKKVKLKY